MCRVRVLRVGVVVLMHWIIHRSLCLQIFWNVGCQLVALNFQSTGMCQLCFSIQFDNIFYLMHTADCYPLPQTCLCS